MQKMFNKFRNKFLPILGIAIFIGITASFSVVAAQKVWNSMGESSQKIQNSKTSILAKTAEANNSEPSGLFASTLVNKEQDNLNNVNDSEDVKDVEKENKTKTQQTETVLAQNSQNTQNNNLNLNNNNQNNNTGNTFTLAQLALHNKSGDCYVAYSGNVYNLSNVAAWAGCQHHGATGGTDITSIFPHPTTYFNSIPTVGTLAENSNNNQNNNNQNNNTNSNQNSNTGSQIQSKQDDRYEKEGGEDGYKNESEYDD